MTNVINADSKFPGMEMTLLDLLEQELFKAREDLIYCNVDLETLKHIRLSDGAEYIHRIIAYTENYIIVSNNTCYTLRAVPKHSTLLREDSKGNIEHTVKLIKPQ